MLNNEVFYDGLGIHSQPFPTLLKNYLHQWLQQMPEIMPTTLHILIMAEIVRFIPVPLEAAALLAAITHPQSLSTPKLMGLSSFAA